MTSPRLFLAEKPSVARAIAAELGGGSKHDGYLQCGADRVAWCFGHMLELAEPDHYLPSDVPKTAKGRKVWRAEDLPILPEKWALAPRKDAAKQLRVLGQLLRAASLVVNAGDPDREGQLLVDEVLEHFAYRGPVLRFWVSAQDSTSVQRGLASLAPNDRYKGLAQAAKARQRADWLIGMNLSRAYTLRARALGNSALLTVGRVQTPTLALVVRRDREIQGFVPKDYFPVHATFAHPLGAFTATFQPPEDMLGLDEEGRLTNGAVADAVAGRVRGEVGRVSALKHDPKTIAPPLLYTLSTLTQEASRRYGLSAEQVLKGAQALYETHKLTSYPRTDCGHMPTSQHADAPKILAAVSHVRPDLSGLVAVVDPSLRSKSWDDSKVTAHHGLAPTMHAGSAAGLSDAEAKLYDLVVRRYLAQFLPAHRYIATRLEITVGVDLFTATGKTVTDDGWKVVEPRDPAPEGSATEHELPAVQQGDRVQCESAERKNAKTRPPVRFTEGTLIAAMERVHAYVEDPEHRKILREGDGIGTPATRATILAELRRREFLVARGKFLESTPLGRGLVDALPQSVCSPALTALYERALHQVEVGERELDDFVALQASYVAARVAEAGQAQVAVAASAQPRARLPRRIPPIGKRGGRRTRKRGGQVA